MNGPDKALGIYLRLVSEDSEHSLARTRGAIQFAEMVGHLDPEFLRQLSRFDRARILDDKQGCAARTKDPVPGSDSGS